MATALGRLRLQLRILPEAQIGPTQSPCCRSGVWVGDFGNSTSKPVQSRPKSLHASNRARDHSHSILGSQKPRFMRDFPRFRCECRRLTFAIRHDDIISTILSDKGCKNSPFCEKSPRLEQFCPPKIRRFADHIPCGLMTSSVPQTLKLKSPPIAS